MREKVKLLSTAGTGHFYVATKNKRLHPERVTTRVVDWEDAPKAYVEPAIKLVVRRD